MVKPLPSRQQGSRELNTLKLPAFKDPFLLYKEIEEKENDVYHNFGINHGHPFKIYVFNKRVANIKINAEKSDVF